MPKPIDTIIPALTLLDENSTEINLGALAQAYKLLVVYFYPADNTPGCTIEAHEFSSLLPDFNAANIGVIGISQDSSDSHASFCQSEALNLTLLSDTKHLAAEAFGVKINTSGEQQFFARETFILNSDLKILKTYDQVSPAGHAAQVLADCQDYL